MFLARVIFGIGIASVVPHAALGGEVQLAEAQKASSQVDCDLLGAAPHDPDRAANGVPDDLLRADETIRACEQAIQNDSNPRYRYQLGRALIGVGEAERGRREFVEAADLGYRAAADALGDIYAVGAGVAVDAERALYWWTKAAEAGHVAAMKKAARTIADSSSGDASNALALRWTERAASTGDAEAMELRGALAIHFTGQVSREAREWLEKAAALGRPTATFLLGLMFLNGAGVERDMRRGVELLQAAAEAGEAAAMNTLGRAYAEGWGVAKDREKALLWYRRSAERGNIDGMKSLGTELKFRTEYSEAIHWLRRASEAGQHQATANLGVSYEYGHGIAVDLREAERLYRLAADNGIASAMLSLGRLHEARGQFGGAATWYEKAAAVGDPDAHRRLERLRSSGRVPAETPTVESPRGSIVWQILELELKETLLDYVGQGLKTDRVDSWYDRALNSEWKRSHRGDYWSATKTELEELSAVMGRVNSRIVASALGSMEVIVERAINRLEAELVRATHVGGLPKSDEERGVDRKRLARMRSDGWRPVDTQSLAKELKRPFQNWLRDALGTQLSWEQTLTNVVFSHVRSRLYEQVR
ncbi:MAG: tetratricopeptide repeat protein [Acidobacteriota bacterium]